MRYLVFDLWTLLITRTGAVRLAKLLLDAQRDRAELRRWD